MGSLTAFFRKKLREMRREWQLRRIRPVEHPPHPMQVRFGFQPGQWLDALSGYHVHNAGWYDETGKRIGFGDISLRNLVAVANGLKDNERFIVLCEEDATSERKYYTWLDTHPKEPVGVLVHHPGMGYLAAHCLFIVCPGALFTLNTRGVIDYEFVNCGTTIIASNRADMERELGIS